MAQSKATKKFEHKHLKETLERRNGLKKTKQKQKLKLKQKARRIEENGGQPLQTENKPSSKEALQALSVDDFFQGDFEVPELTKGSKRQRDEQPSDGSSDTESEDHQEQLDALAQRDPEFHKYLQENEPELLDSRFGEEAVASGSDEEMGDEQPRKKQKLSEELSMATVEKWTTAVQQEHSLRAAREIVKAFRSAVSQSDDEEKQFKYSVCSDAEVYHALLTTALKDVSLVLQHHLPAQDIRGKSRVPTDSPKFKSIVPLIKSYAMSITELLETLTDAATLKLTLSAALSLLPYLLSFKKLVRDLCKTITNVWASIATNTESTRIAAFLVLRKLMTIGDAGIRENVLKSAYQGLVASSRQTTVHTLAGINLMKNSAAELWGLDSSTGYTTGFNFIRQLAIHLRNSITNRTKESYKTVYNWQFTHSLDFWSRVLSLHTDSTLQPLIYPLVQVTLGALRLIPTATYFPLRFQLIRALLRISTTGTYIPLAASLYEVLNSADMRKPPKPTNSALKPLDFTVSIRAPASYLRTRVYQESVGEQVQELFSEFCGIWTKNIAFPELALAIIVMLKRWLKDVNGTRAAGNKSARTNVGNKNPKVNGMIALLVQKIEANARFIEEKRAQVDYTPNNRNKVDTFLKDLDWEKTPMGAFVKGVRRQKEARQQQEEYKRESNTTTPRHEEVEASDSGQEDASDIESD